MNKAQTQSFMYDYCIVRLNLQDVKINCTYEKRIDGNNKAIGQASGRWDGYGNLVGGLEIKVVDTCNIYQNLDTIAHELVHIQQYVRGSTYFIGKTRYFAGGYDNFEYYDRACEREARNRAKIIVRNFIERYWHKFSWYVKLNIVLGRKE